jgi:hypothetical protein
MSKMRKNGGAFAYAGKAPTPVEAASLADKWPAAPVITEENFNKHVAAMREKGVYDGPESFKDYKAAIDPLSTEALAASSKEAEEIANTWAQWLDRFYATRPDLKPKGRYTCTNGGHTNRHGLNPVMHTLMEDWFKEPEPTHPQLPKRQKT